VTTSNSLFGETHLFYFQKNYNCDAQYILEHKLQYQNKEIKSDDLNFEEAKLVEIEINVTVRKRL